MNLTTIQRTVKGESTTVTTGTNRLFDDQDKEKIQCNQFITFANFYNCL